jgi:dTDP-glucose 4,6-dehydratase
VETIVGGTRRVLDFASCAGVRKVLLLSSGAVYGTQPPDMAAIPEDYPGAPQPRDRRFAYGEGKRVAESLCCAAADRTGWEAKVARCFTFAGPRLPLDGPFAIGNFVRDALARRPIRVRGDGSAIRSYLYASDLAAWLWTILFRGCPDRAYNVGSDWAISIADLARTVAAILPGGVPVEIVAPGGGQTPLQRYVPDIGRAAAELGLRVRVPLEEAIRRMAAWYERCPGYCSAIGAVP